MAAVVLASGVGAAVLLGTVLAGVADGARRGAPVPPADALLACLAALGLLVLVWLLLAVLLEALCLVPGAVGRGASRVAEALSPMVVRRVAALVLGLGVGASGLVAGTASAQVRAVAPAPTTSADPLPDPAWRPAPDPGWTPTAPTVRAQPDVTVVSGRGRAPAAVHEVVVHRGDSLWSIAARHLGPGATDAEVAAEWPRWYAANRGVVGPDPDHLLPGQVLHAPVVVGS
ncbi:LysM peptidoglycan-binding domain-containing protein [Phycicoccus avicenniae]|uniref:LysM peptidoglycan-binding domain-containing protein n=1 Tax=Phycicoccus avicenniae TaxID=2828860 RepID=UPI003D2D6D9C